VVKVGDTVKMVSPTPDETGTERFRVLELRGDRVLVEFVCDLRIPPTYVYPTSDVEVVEINGPPVSSL
jgi:hypothetical protein